MGKLQNPLSLSVVYNKVILYPLYLFPFCMDILSRMLSMAENIAQIQGIKISLRAPSITHLFLLTMR